jgi:hypothetical protein
MNRYFSKKNPPPVYMRNELRLRAIGWWILRDGLVWFGLVWSGVLLHSHVLFWTCLHGLNATNEVVMCCSFFPFFASRFPLARCKVVFGKRGRQPISGFDRQQEQWESKRGRKFRFCHVESDCISFHVVA